MKGRARFSERKAGVDSRRRDCTTANEPVSPPSLSIVERAISKGPFPNAQSSLLSRVLNIIFISCTLPLAGIVYIHFSGAKILDFSLLPQPMPIEILVLWIAIFLLSYTSLIYCASGRLREFFTNVKPCLDCDERFFQEFEKNTIERSFKPPFILLTILISLVPLMVFGVASAPFYTGDPVITVLLGLILLYSNILSWIASWMLLTFLSASSRFGRDLQLRVNPFDPDKVGGLEPLSDLSTLAIFCVGLLSLEIIPLWQIFYSPASYVITFINSILIPAYFLYSMRGIYYGLKKEKRNSLNELNCEIQRVSKKIREFMKSDHENEQREDREILALGQTLNSLDIIYGHIQSMHTFPINAEIMAKVFLGAVLPLMFIVVDFVLSHYL